MKQLKEIKEIKVNHNRKIIVCIGNCDRCILYYKEKYIEFNCYDTYMKLMKQEKIKEILK